MQALVQTGCRQSSGLLGKLPRETSHNRLRYDAPAAASFDVGERRFGRLYASLLRPLEREAGRKLEPLSPQIRCHSRRLTTDLRLDASIDRHRDEAEADETDRRGVEIEVELRRDFVGEPLVHALD